MFGVVAKPVLSPCRRAVRRAGALLALLGIVLIALPVGPAQAVVRTAAGLRGTVLGRTAHYGTYFVPGVGNVLCLDASKVAPDSEYDYRLGGPIGGTLGAQLAYAAAAYGNTTDAVTAAAAKLVVHDLQGAVYPQGPLDVFRLQVSQLAFGGGGRESAILSRARAQMTDVLANYRVGPYRLSMSTPPTLDEEHRVPVAVTLLDGRGRALPGFKVTVTGSNTTVSSVVLTTDARGQARTTFTAADPDGQVRFAARAVLPSAAPIVWAPTRPDAASRAQRVIFGGTTPVTASRTVAPAPDTKVTVTVAKSGDVTAYHPVDGAQFELHANTPDGPKLAGPVTVEDGTATFPEVVTTDLESLWLVETVAPDGYAKADPVAVPLEGTPTIVVVNEARRGEVALVKVDAISEEPVAGAVLHLRYDADDDGAFETDLGTVTSGTAPVPVGDLLPGRYEVTEVAAPPGYALPDEGARQVVLLEPGGVLRVAFADLPLTTVGFRKTPAGTFNPATYTLAGAVFVVTDGRGGEAGRCTTDVTGACTLPEHSLLVGQRYCWAETVAPPGFTKAEGGCFSAARREQMTVLGVAEQGAFATIGITKRDTSPTGKGLPGAAYELWLDDGTGPLATATTGPDGTLRFPPQLPGRTYCVREVAAPAGYQLDPQMHCTREPVGDGDSVGFDLVNRRLPTPTPTVTTPPQQQHRRELPRTGAGESAALSRIGAACLLAGAGLLLGTPRRRVCWASVNGRQRAR